MERVRRLRRIWTWLPAFRAAAESEHLPTAAELLHVSASSISRTVRLLEDELGHALFERSGRTIRLNREGQRFLVAVRDAMRILDEGVIDIAQSALTGAVDVAVPRHLATVLVTPALAAVPEALLVRVHVDIRDVVHELTRGALDVAVVEDITPHPDLSVAVLTELTHGIYASADHPLARRRSPARELDDAAFVASPGDRWPIERARRVVAHASDPGLALHMCRDRSLCTVAPDVLGAPTAPALVRLRGDIARPSPVYLVHRRPVAGHPRTDAVVSALRAHAAALA